MNRIRTRWIITALGGVFVVTSACNREPNEPSEPREQAAEVQKEASEEMRANNREAQQTTNEAQQQAREDNATIQAKANEEIRKANAALESEKVALVAWSQTKLDELNALIDAARVKAVKAPARLQASFEAGMKEVQAKRDELANEVASIKETGTTKATDFKNHMDTEVNRLRTRIEGLERAL